MEQGEIKYIMKADTQKKYTLKADLSAYMESYIRRWGGV